MSYTPEMFHRFSSPLYQTLFKGIDERERSSTTVSLYVIEDRTYEFRKIDITELMADTRRISQWGQENRLAAVVQKGHEVFAHVSPQMAIQLKKRDLSINGEQVTVQALRKDEYDLLSTQVIQEWVEESKATAKEKEEKVLMMENKHHLPLQIIPDKSRAKRDEVFLKQIEAFPDKIKKRLLEKWHLDNLVEDERRKEKDKQARLKAQEIEYFEIKKDVKKEDIRNTTIQNKEKVKASRTHQARKTSKKSKEI